jgi:flagellar protein FlaF
MKASQTAPEVETMRDAARLNWRLWTILQSELLDPTSPVPLALRNDMLSLARFVDQRTVAFLAEPSPSLLDVLISINRELAAGLQSQPATGTPARKAVPPGGEPSATRLSV